MKTCCQPDAPWVKCNVCSKPLKTCESDKPIEGTQFTYVCSVHQDGAQLDDGRWLCDNCYYNLCPSCFKNEGTIEAHGEYYCGECVVLIYE